MKRNWILLFAVVMVLCLSGAAEATLFDRGNGLIYDDHLDITWLQDANINGQMTWDAAVAWADTLVYEGYDDWRLPTTVDGIWELGYDGTTTAGYNITTSEMGYMFYENLGNLGKYDTNGTLQSGSGLTNVDFIDGTTAEIRSFENLQAINYWSGTQYAANPENAWYFRPYNGSLSQCDKEDNTFYAWAVRPGDVSAVHTPIPGTVLLLVSGLVGLGAFGRGARRRRG